MKVSSAFYSLQVPLLSCCTILLLLFSSGCSSENSPPQTVPVIPVSEELVSNNTAFALNLYQQLKNREGNLFFSPYSISTALAMTFAGARGDTERQMAQTLHFTLPQDHLHPAFAVLKNNLNAAQEKGLITILIANSLWPDAEYPLKKEFLECVTRNYQTHITALDYIHQPETARKTINTWVEDKTNDKIKDLVPPGILDGTTKLVLANAIYFKGDWANSFKKSDTRELPFHVSPSQTVSTPLMFQKDEFGYYEDSDIQMLKLLYAGERLSMIVILPRKQENLDAIEHAITVNTLQHWIDGLHTIDVSVWLPKFTSTDEFNLGTALKELGMIDPFNAHADFSGMDGTSTLFISAVIHKAFVDINEKGTEAAAATGVEMALTSVSIATEFRADHPFLFFIYDNNTKSILFMGRLLNPTN